MKFAIAAFVIAAVSAASLQGPVSGTHSAVAHHKKVKAHAKGVASHKKVKKHATKAKPVDAYLKAIESGKLKNFTAFQADEKKHQAGGEALNSTRMSTAEAYLKQKGVEARAAKAEKSAHAAWKKTKAAVAVVVKHRNIAVHN